MEGQKKNDAVIYIFEGQVGQSSVAYPGQRPIADLPLVGDYVTLAEGDETFGTELIVTKRHFVYDKLGKLSEVKFTVAEPFLAVK